MLVALIAGLAAPIAHMGIDVLGDYLLAHDTFDDIAHGSRTIVCCSALVMFGMAACWLLSYTLDEVRRAPSAPRLRLPTDPFTIGLCLAIVVGATFALLAGMERADVAIAGRQVDDLGDLLGGSIWLGVAVTLPITLAIAYCTWQIARWAIGAQRAALRILGTWLRVCARQAGVACIRSERLPVRSSLTPVLARNVSKRGPPRLPR